MSESLHDEKMSRDFGASGSAENYFEFRDVCKSFD
jgi:hypothetical protein